MKIPIEKYLWSEKNFIKIYQNPLIVLVTQVNSYGKDNVHYVQLADFHKVLKIA